MSPSFQGKPTNINLHHPNRIKKIGKVFLGLLIILVLAALAIGYLVFPKVQVNIKVLAENFSKTAEVRVSGSETALDPSVYAGKMIDVTKEKEDKFQATGKKNLGGKAAGSITIYNNLDSSNHSFSAGTKLSSSSKTFLLKSAATVPGATVQNLKIVPGVVTVEIEAENPGEDYNIDAGRFTIIGLSAAQQEAIYGQSTKDMLGGFSKEVQVISQDDYDQAKTKLVADLNGQIDQEIKKDAADLQILDKSTVVETAQPKVSANVGDQASEFTMQISVRGRVIAFAQDGFRTFVITTFEKELPSEKMLTLGPDDKISPSVKETQYDKKLLVLNVDLTGKSSIRLDQDKIKKDLLGKNKGEFTSLLNKVDGISSWTIDFTPPWWIKRIPNYPKNIAINLEYVLKDTQPVLDGSKELN